MSFSRRGFLAASAAAAVHTAFSDRAASAAEGKKNEMLPIVDTHQHLWDLKLFKPPWLADAPKVLAKTHVTKDFLEATQGLNVVKAVYMEVDVHPRDKAREAQHVIELCKSSDHPTVAAVISGVPNSPGFRDHILAFKGNPYVKGVRQVVHVDSTPRGLCLEKQFVASCRLLGELGMSFDLCMRPRELEDGVRLVDQCKETTFIVDHCGNADPKAWLPKAQQKEEPWHEVDAWKRAMAAFAARQNVLCKISGIVARAPEGWKADHLAPIINYCLDTFGPQRVVFGGDWPVCKLGATYRQWVTALKEVISERPQAEQKRLLHDNAVRQYKLG